ncbi:CPXCG motif-containing cysteine-rich protein [Pseudomonadota bacterium]
MMNFLQEVAIQCPYCGEHITVVADASEAGQSYIEDCEVCCRPITLKLSISATEEISIEAWAENDA